MIRQLIERFRSDARRTFGAFPGVYEMHVNPDDESDVFGGVLTAPPSVFTNAWGYCMGEAVLPADLDERQFIAVIHNDGVVLTELES
jgi:hypothetical protein